MELVLSPAGRINSRITDQKRSPLDGGMVTVMGSDQGARLTGPPAMASSNAAGDYSISGVARGLVSDQRDPN
jgi:hypothetical protein